MHIALGLFDSRAGLSVVDSHLLERSAHGVVDLGSVDVGTSTGSQVSMRLVRVPHVRIGALTISDALFLSTDLSTLRATLGAPVRVIVGANLINGACWTFAPRQSRYLARRCDEEGW